MSCVTHKEDKYDNGDDDYDEYIKIEFNEHRE